MRNGSELERRSAREAMMTASMQKKRLGRGLTALLGDEIATDFTPPEDQRMVPVSALRSSRFNPRRQFDETPLQELADSIRQRGLVQPLVVRPAADARDVYEIVAGERRWRAAQLANLHEVPVVVRNLTDQEAVELAIIENVQRADLNAIEEAEGYRLLMDEHAYTQEDLARVIGKSRSHLANTLRLLKLPEIVRRAVQSGELSAGHARTLIGRLDAELLAARIMREGLSVRQAEALVQKGESKRKARTAAPREKDADTRAVEAELEQALGLDVELRPGRGEQGELRIRYATLEQLEELRGRLLRRLSR
jgi:ParB family transcriptional regulator, chromosome partitioning protein